MIWVLIGGGLFLAGLFIFLIVTDPGIGRSSKGGQT